MPLCKNCRTEISEQIFKEYYQRCQNCYQKFKAKIGTTLIISGAILAFLGFVYYHMSSILMISVGVGSIVRGVSMRYNRKEE